jgi:hypothetical protein
MGGDCVAMDATYIPKKLIGRLVPRQERSHPPWQISLLKSRGRAYDEPRREDFPENGNRHGRAATVVVGTGTTRFCKPRVILPDPDPHGAELVRHRVA